MNVEARNRYAAAADKNGVVPSRVIPTMDEMVAKHPGFLDVLKRMADK